LKLENLIIAEIGSVHDGSFGNAKRLIDLASECGADAVKFQTHLPEFEMVRGAPNPPYFSGEDRDTYFRRTSFSRVQWGDLANHAKSIGLTFLSSPFSIEAVDLLESINMEVYKIPSGEITNTPLLERISLLNKPVLLSSGMSTWSELDDALSILTGSSNICLMQCTTAYPCPPSKVGLNVLDEIRQRYPHLKLGFSDHTLGPAAAIAAASRGATVIEKHLTFSRQMYGSDAKNSMEPEEFTSFVKWIREVWEMARNRVSKDELDDDLRLMKRTFEKSIFVNQSMKGGQSLQLSHLSFKKPGDGISARYYREIVDRALVRDVPADHKLEWSDLV
jgi:N,N'-diacetyllegionaminate synthase